MGEVGIVAKGTFCTVGVVAKGAVGTGGGSSGWLPINVCSGPGLLDEGCGVGEGFGGRHRLTGRGEIIPLGAAVARGGTEPMFLVLGAGVLAC